MGEAYNQGPKYPAAPSAAELYAMTRLPADFLKKSLGRITGGPELDSTIISDNIRAAEPTQAIVFYQLSYMFNQINRDIRTDGENYLDITGTDTVAGARIRISKRRDRLGVYAYGAEEEPQDVVRFTIRVSGQPSGNKYYYWYPGDIFEVEPNSKDFEKTADIRVSRITADGEQKLAATAKEKEDFMNHLRNFSRND